MIDAVGFLVLPLFAGVAVWFVLHLLMDLMLVIWSYVAGMFGND